MEQGLERLPRRPAVDIMSRSMFSPDSGALLADTYRIPMPQGADGVMLIVYRATAGGFENLLELPLEGPFEK